MKIAVDKNVPIPAYQQVVDGIAAAIRRGEIVHGSRLPSVRNLAVDLGLNVNTVARAYRDLERAGLIDTMPGMGTFVASKAPPVETWPTTWAQQARGAARPGVVAELEPAPVAGSWRELLAAAHALASAEGLSEEQFVEEAVEAARSRTDHASLLVVGGFEGEAADLLRCLPTEVAATAAAVRLDELRASLAAGGVASVVTTFPAMGRVRAELGAGADSVAVVPVETELTEETVRRLSELPPSGRIALVTIEKDHWDQEANDVMKIVGRNRWLKMVLLDNGERGLTERLEQVDAVLHVPRASDAVARAAAEGLLRVELARQLTPRTRERLLEAVGPAD